ncbi:hypothetical protein QJQ45_013412 [Haematococcus lacustris]|nr:hypothetical protein QJQ45_013412 [Haematococcus lacustris]
MNTDQCKAFGAIVSNVPSFTTSQRKLRGDEAVLPLRQYDPASRPKQDLEQLVSAVEELPFLSSSSQVEQTSQLLWCFADWVRRPENNRARMTQAQCNAVLALLQRMAVGARAGKAGNPPEHQPLQQFDARQLNMSAWSLGKLKPHLPAAAVTSACTAIARHSASSEAMKRGSWRDWGNLLHGLATAGMQCSSSPDLTRLCDQAVQLLPERLAWGVASQNISMTLWAMAKSGYTGSAQPLLQSVTSAISQGVVMRDAKPQEWANLIWATSKLPGCREEARQLLDQFAIRGMRVVAYFNGQEVSNILYAMGLVLWHDKEVYRQLAERAAQTQQVANGQDWANSLYGLARLGYLDSSVRSLAAGVAMADLAAFTTQAIANLLYARSMFLALSIHQAVSSGHSQLASEPQLNSMAAALWRECSRRGQSKGQWSDENLTQVHTANQWLHACTAGQVSLAASPALQKLVAKTETCKKSIIVKLQTVLMKDCSQQLVQALAAAGHAEVQQAVISQDGTFCTQLLVRGPRLNRGTKSIAIMMSSDFLEDGSMSGVVAHVKLQQLTHFDAGVVVNKAVFDQLASDSKRAAFMREQVQASLPEAEAWRQLLQAEEGHCAGQVEAPPAATPAAQQQQQAVSVSAGQQARQQGALPLPAAQAKSAGALPSQRAGQAPGLVPRPVRPRRIARSVSDTTSRKLRSDEAVIRESGTPLRQFGLPPRPKQDMGELTIAVVKLPYLDNSKKVEQTSQLLWCSADWAMQLETSIAHMTEYKSISGLKLLQGMAGEPWSGTAGSPPAPLEQIDARQLSKAAWSLGKLKPHLPAAAVTSACTALARHSVSSEAMKRGSWREWSTLLHGLATAGMQCSSSPDLTRLCDQAVQLLPVTLAWGAASQNISMTLWAMAKSGYTGSAQPLLQSVTSAISQGVVMRDAVPQAWANLIWAASKLPGCREEARQLLSLFVARAQALYPYLKAVDTSNIFYSMSLVLWHDKELSEECAIRGMSQGKGCARAQAVVPELNAQNVSNILYAMGLVLWHDKEVYRQLAERAAQTQQVANGQDWANSLYGLARLGYLDSSVCSLAAGVAKADMAAFTTQAIANLLYARSMFLALSIHQAVSSGHSQLASEPQLNSMAAALWRECSRRGQGEEQWGEEGCVQLHTASQWLHACTGGQISLSASPALQELLAKARTCKNITIVKLQTVLKSDCSQLVQALAAAGHDDVQQAVLSKDGTHCTQLQVLKPGLTRGISVEEIPNFLPDGSMSGVVAHAKLQHLTHFDTGVMVRASLPEAEAWRQLLQAGGGHCAGQVEAPAAATPAAQQQQAVSVSQASSQPQVVPLTAAKGSSSLAAAVWLHHQGQGSSKGGSKRRCVMVSLTAATVHQSHDTRSFKEFRTGDRAGSSF